MSLILTKSFKAARPGEIYPTEYLKDTECPEDLVALAVELGALPESAKAAGEAKAAKPKPAKTAKTEKDPDPKKGDGTEKPSEEGEGADGKAGE